MTPAQDDFSLFGCVAGALAKRADKIAAGVGAALLAPVAGAVAGIPIAAEIAGDVKKCLEEKAKRRKEADAKAAGDLVLAELQRLPHMTPADADAAARRAVAAYPNLPDVHRELVLHYLKRIPDQARRSFRRPEDPDGRSVRPGAGVRDVLPDRLSGLREGEPVPGHAGWTLDRQLGSGGFGEVWLAVNGDQKSVFKFAFELTDAERDNLRHEAELVLRAEAALGPHPNLVPLRDKNLNGPVPWLRYDLVDGGDLLGKIHALRLVPAAERAELAAAVLAELATAVGLLHRLPTPIVHRDLKPANVLFDTATGRYRITDFGIGGVAARRELDDPVGVEQTRGGGVLPSRLAGSHSAIYASPEQVRGEAPDPRDDVHALGVIGYELMRGVREHRLDPDALPEYERKLVGEGCPARLAAVICRAIGPAADRPKDAEEMAALLRPTPWPVSGRAAVIVAAAVAACLLCVLVGRLTVRSTPPASTPAPTETAAVTPPPAAPQAPSPAPTAPPAAKEQSPKSSAGTTAASPPAPVPSAPPAAEPPLQNEFALEPVRTIDAGERGYSPNLAFSPDGMLATSYRFRDVRLWKLDKPEAVASVTAGGRIEGLAYGRPADGTPLYVLTRSLNSTVERRDGTTGALTRELPLEEVAADRLAISRHDGKVVVVGSQSYTTADPDILDRKRVREVWNAALTARLGRTEQPEADGLFLTNPIDATSVKWSGSQLVFTSADGKEVMSESAPQMPLTGTPEGGKYSPDGKWLVGRRYCDWCIVDAATRKSVKAHRAPGYVRDLAVTPDGRRLVVAYDRDERQEFGVDVYSVPDGTLCSRMTVPTEGRLHVHELAISPDGRHLAASLVGEKRQVGIWQIKPVPPAAGEK